MAKRAAKRRRAEDAAPEPVWDADMPAHLIGSVLRGAREKLGLSVADVSGRTKVSPRFIESIDDARFDAFISPIYAVGHTRAYARAVAVPADWAAAKVRELVGPGWVPQVAAD